MNKLEEKVFIGKSINELSEFDFDFIMHVLKEKKINTNLIQGIRKLCANFFNTVYQVNIQDSNKQNISIFIKSSPHKNFFLNDKRVHKFYSKSGQNSPFATILSHGIYLNTIEYCVYINKHSYILPNVLTDNIDQVSKSLGIVCNYFNDSAKSFGLKSLADHKKTAKSFFDLLSFYKYENKNKKKSFLSKYTDIDEDIFFNFYNDAFKYFDEEVLSKLSDSENQVCSGIKFPEDIIVSSDSYVPIFISNFLMYRGDPVLEMLFNCRILNINEVKYLSHYREKNEIINRYKKLYDKSWIIEISYIYFNKLMLSFYSKPVHSFSNLLSEQVYLINRARMKRIPEFSKYIKSFNDFFIEK